MERNNLVRTDRSVSERPPEKNKDNEVKCNEVVCNEVSYQASSK